MVGVAVDVVGGVTTIEVVVVVLVAVRGGWRALGDGWWVVGGHHPLPRPRPRPLPLPLRMQNANGIIT